MSEFIASIEAPNCDLNSGYPISAGSLVMRSSVGRPCSTDLFFNIGDYIGNTTWGVSGGRLLIR